ncbi:hypothetical protein ULMS_03170 [Patiriisocius marinistellae]|uniref:Secretion system C-terminal sorting domain-containing protein n=1 Tax=Patiriisocius marinistellae TaxID=2494560 RepID=A0A5J4FXI8_9FLAO|nr:T9SS type A sorting domain-containing protein [Patiriisocius marinistellae]GEQ84809.1 hypothetical protein ULMS_03170 [Patiriisocius marinistellae]
MKNILFALIMLQGILLSAQDPQLFSTTWYLRNIVVNNTDNFPPVIARLEFYDSNPYGISLGICEDFYSSQLTFNNTEETFSIFGGWLSGAGDCNNQTFETYRLFYYNFYEGNESMPFEYLITQTGNELSLIITAGNGDKAFYGNTMLSTQEQSKLRITLFPNPAKDVLMISTTNIESSTVIIYNMLGKEVMTAVIDTNLHQLNVASLRAGMYLIQVTASDGKKQTFKFIKE